ncbi:MAG: glycosyltransferase [Kineosporiaceae bacterium]
MRTGTRAGLVTVVIVDYKGAADTITAVTALGALEWPRENLEIVVVDNAPGHGSAARIRAACPEAVVVESDVNSGFAGGCNLGVRHSHGEYIAFLNNDARPHPRWVAEAVQVLDRDRSVAAVASKVLDWDGSHVDYVDGSLTWFGMGYKRETTRPDSPDYDTAKDVLFGTGSAMFVRADAYREVGGFDERFFMFYEDVDLGWRLNLLGRRVRYVPTSLAYHKHHASMRAFGQYREDYLLERNALLAMYKNFSDETLGKALPAALALSVRRSIARSGIDPMMHDLVRSPGGDEDPDVTVPKDALTGPLAIDYLVENLPGLTADREALQRDRRRSDRDLFPLFRQAIEPAHGYPSYLEAHRALVEAFGIEEHFASRHRVLVVTGEPLKRTMAGPAIRAWEMAKALAAENDVVLGTMTRTCELDHSSFRTAVIDGGRMRELERWADVIIFQGFLLEGHPWLMDSDKVVVADVYDPMHLEQLEQARDLGEQGRRHSVTESTRVLNDQLRRADFLLCASAKQRDFWLGHLAALGRVNPAVYDADETLEGLIASVPFGIPDEPPVQRRRAIKGSVPGIGESDKVVLWGGGIYNWFDPLTLIRAVEALARRRPQVKLFFLGVKHPNPGVPDMRMAWEARRLAEQKGLVGTHVFFNEGWVPYEERADYLLDCDLGVSCHLDHVETAFSFRTRILDYLWAGLPVVATAGDTFADIIEREGLGRTVGPEDVDGLERALEEMLFDDEAVTEARKAVERVAQSFTWSRSLEPLVRFCRTPARAPDLADGSVLPARSFRAPRPRLRDDLELAKRYFAGGGVREVLSRASGRVRRITRERLSAAR